MERLARLIKARAAILAINNAMAEYANVAQITLHDDAVGAGQHHGVRVVTIQSLIDDIDEGIARIQQFEAKRAGAGKQEKPGGGGGSSGKSAKKAAKPASAASAAKAASAQ